jgi:thiamine monophosphate synthase
MFEDQKIELLPARTTMKRGGFNLINQSGNTAVAAAVNAGNINVGGDQANVAVAAALAGSNVFIGG